MATMKKSNNILILGSIALDTIKTKFGKRNDLLGGSATYATIAAGMFSQTIPVGVVGDDFPKSGYDIFDKYSKKINNIKTKTGDTFRWGGLYHNNGDDRDTLFTELGVFENFEPIIHNDDRDISWLFLANIHPLLQKKVLQQCNNDPFVITDTMNLWIDTTPTDLNEIIKSTTILLINESELKHLTKLDQIDKGAREILTAGPEKVIVKLGSKGSCCFSKHEKIKVGVYPVKKVVDPTGAGDVFGGGLISGLVDGLTMLDSMKRATAISSLCIEDFGIEKLVSATQEEINRRINLIE